MQIISPVDILNMKLHGHCTREGGENRHRCFLGLLDVADWGILEIIIRCYTQTWLEERIYFTHAVQKQQLLWWQAEGASYWKTTVRKTTVRSLVAPPVSSVHGKNTAYLHTMRHLMHDGWQQRGLGLGSAHSAGVQWQFSGYARPQCYQTPWVQQQQQLFVKPSLL